MIIGDTVSVEGATYVVKLRPDLTCNPFIGEFVGIDAGSDRVVGVISSTVNRVKEELLPYMDSEKIPKFLPYVEDYSEKLLIVQGLGILCPEGGKQGAVPAVGLKASVSTMEDPDVLQFHRIGEEFSAGYIFKLRDRLDPQVGVVIIDRLTQVLPEEMGANLKAAKRLLEGGGFQ